MNCAATSGKHVIVKAPTIMDKWAKALIIQLLSRMRYGKIILRDSEGIHVFGNDPDICASIYVTDPKFYWKVLFGGSIGAGEAYIEKMWEVDDLTSLVRVMVLNMELLDRMEQGFAWILHPFRLLNHKLNRNSTSGSKRNILSHYDLGNEMYKSFLDPTMMYSAARYRSDVSTLEEASIHKLKNICEKLDLQPTDTVIEIGAGWCGFAIYAAEHYGCHVTTTTISDAQYKEGTARIEAAGLTDKITLIKKDYRELTGKFDKLVSIEMIEAVGHEYLPGFFKKCSQLLKVDGMMLLQAITIKDQKYKQYVTGVDFIQRHIFPGGCVPSNNRMLDLMTGKTDMVVRHLEDFGFDYARTIQDWRKRFNKAFPTLAQYGYDEKFQRLWNFYLCYCEGGFLERAISVVHVVATRPGNRHAINLLSNNR